MKRWSLVIIVKLELGKTQRFKGRLLKSHVYCLFSRQSEDRTSPNPIISLIFVVFWCSLRCFHICFDWAIDALCLDQNEKVVLAKHPLTNDEEHYTGHLKMMSKKFSTTATCLNINLTFPSTSCWKREVVSKETLKFRRSFGSCSVQYFGSDFIFLLLLQKLQFSDTMQPLTSQNISSRNSIIACFSRILLIVLIYKQNTFQRFCPTLNWSIIGAGVPLWSIYWQCVDH